MVFSWRGDLHHVVPDAVEVLVVARVVELVGALHEGGRRTVGLLADALDGVVGRLRAVGEGTRRLVALLLERGGELGGLLRHVGQQLHVLELLDLVHGVADAQRAERGRGDHGEREQRHQAGGDAPVAQGYSRAGAAGALRLGGAGGRGARGTAHVFGPPLPWAPLGAPAARGALTAVTGLCRSWVLGVLGRGTAAGPALRLRLRRSAAIPLETSLH